MRSNIQRPACSLLRVSAVLLVAFHTLETAAGFSSTVSHQREQCLEVAADSKSPRLSTTSRVFQLAAKADDDADSTPSDKDDVPDENDTDIHEQLQSRHDHLQVEKTRTALEDQHTKSFLKRRPVKLPYEAARKWVQANLGASTKEEFDDLVANGNLRTPYIPKRPEEYYTSTREWISWEHFLTGVFDDEQPSEIKPPTGVFD